MNRLFLSVLLLYFIFIMPSFAQSDVKIKKDEFMKGKSGFKQAWDHVIAGDANFVKKGSYYNNAFDHYIQAIVYNNSNPELNYKTGIAAIYTDHKEEAAGFLVKALKAKNDVSDDIFLYTGRALQYSGNYDEAINMLTAYLKTKVKKSESNVNLAKKFIAECNSAIVLTNDSIQIEITNMGANINSESDDLSPVLTYDGQFIYFASLRKYKKSSGSTAILTTDENIYVSNLINNKWGIAILAGKDINTDYNESPLFIDSAGTRLYIYSGFENGGDIKVSVNKKGQWRVPEGLPLNINTVGSETSIAFSQNGNEVYYITNDGKDNYGEHDIYYIKKGGDKKWSKPQNAGPSVNTVYDEQSVSLSKSGDTLWFSSKGHNSIGGFDIFYSIRNQDGTWNQAVNAGYPLNTSWDELFRSSAPSSGSSFYFVSNRSGGFGGLDIYKGRILSQLPEIQDEVQVVSSPDSLINADTVSVETVNDSTIIQPSENSSETNKPVSEPPGENGFDADNGKFFIRED
jgi:tetratricopeptide (TPR) repeat protein